MENAQTSERVFPLQQPVRRGNTVRVIKPFREAIAACPAEGTTGVVIGQAKGGMIVVRFELPFTDVDGSSWLKTEDHTHMDI